jgi:predicted alpha/beta-hydrolase family hydrolase
MVKPFFLFAPGAGAPSSHYWMQRWRAHLEIIGQIQLFDYAYMREGRRRPDPLPRLIATHRHALAEARKQTNAPVILIGKSMGGRIGCHVSLEEPVKGLICLGYPLCGGGDPAKMRDQVLRALTTPILFVQGTHDPLCPLDLLERVRLETRAPTFLHIVEGGNHSLLASKRQLEAAGETQHDVDARIVGAIASFVEGL